MINSTYPDGLNTISIAGKSYSYFSINEYSDNVLQQLLAYAIGESPEYEKWPMLIYEEISNREYARERIKQVKQNARKEATTGPRAQTASGAGQNQLGPVRHIPGPTGPEGKPGRDGQDAPPIESYRLIVSHENKAENRTLKEIFQDIYAKLDNKIDKVGK